MFILSNRSCLGAEAFKINPFALIFFLSFVIYFGGGFLLFFFLTFFLLWLPFVLLHLWFCVRIFFSYFCFFVIYLSIYCPLSFPFCPLSFPSFCLLCSFLLRYLLHQCLFSVFSLHILDPILWLLLILILYHFLNISPRNVSNSLFHIF